MKAKTPVKAPSEKEILQERIGLFRLRVEDLELQIKYAEARITLADAQAKMKERFAPTTSGK
jgi:hypothetical protein